MAVSRSGAEFLRRHGIIDADPRPMPRLSVDDLLVNFLPLAVPPMPDKAILRNYEGDPSPDRAGARPLPHNNTGGP